LSETTTIVREQREALLGQRGATVWFTGLSGSGKTTVAVAVERALFARGKLVKRLDGDVLRGGINGDLGFSPQDRAENIRRVGEIAKLFADTGVICLCSFISPYRAGRDAARSVHEAVGIPFFEVFVDCPLSVAETRDPKGLYKRARAGEIPDFTGISAPYEAPEAPDLRLRSHQERLEDEVARVVAALLGPDAES